MATITSTKSATAAQTQDLPTIVLVQGSFQIPEVYSKVIRGLVAQGYPTIHPQLPSCSNTDNLNFPQLSLVDDALAIRIELIRQIEYEWKIVVMVLHSYGGLVGSEAIPEERSPGSIAQLKDYQEASSTSFFILRCYLMRVSRY